MTAALISAHGESRLRSPERLAAELREGKIDADAVVILYGALEG